MVERVHSVVAAVAVVVGVGVPAFPDRGCALSDRIEPGSVFGLLKHLVCLVNVTRIGEGGEEWCGADKSGGNGVASRFAGVGKVLLSIGFVGIVKDVVGERQRIGSLRVLELAPGDCLVGIRIDVGCVPLRLDAFRISCIQLRILLISHYRRHFSHRTGCVVEGCICEHRGVGFHNREVICKEAGHRGEVFLASCLAAHQAAHMQFHRVVVLFNEGLVSILEVGLIGNDDARCAPAVTERSAAADVVITRCEHGENTIGLVLSIALQRGEVSVECVHICKVGRSSGEHLGVSRPAEPLVALWAVCRDREVVAVGRAHDIVKQLVGQFI